MNILRKYLFDNLPLKLGSLALAFLLWTAIAKEPPVEVAFNAPLEFRNTPQGMELSSETPASVQVRVRGPASTVRQLAPSDLAVSLDLADFQRPGERSYALAVSDVKAPFGARVVQIIPALVSVRFEARDSASNIACAEYSLDAGDWTLVFPVGRLADAPQESYELLLRGLAPGEHTLAVRVHDQFQNIATGKVTFTVPAKKP